MKFSFKKSIAETDKEIVDSIELENVEEPKENSKFDISKEVEENLNNLYIQLIRSNLIVSNANSVFNNLGLHNLVNISTNKMEVFNDLRYKVTKIIEFCCKSIEPIDIEKISSISTFEEAANALMEAEVNCFTALDKLILSYKDNWVLDCMLNEIKMTVIYSMNYTKKIYTILNNETDTILNKNITCGGLL